MSLSGQPLLSSISAPLTNRECIDNTLSNANEMELPAPQTENRGQIGLQLRKARKICRLSIETVALQLHMDPKVIKALEEDDFSQLMPVFVRGYLRNYARLVNLPVEPLLESYNRIAAAESPPVEVTPQSPDRSNAGWGFYLLIAALGVPLFLWAGYEARHRFDEMSKPYPQSGVGPAITPEATSPTAVTSAATPPGEETASVSPRQKATAPPSDSTGTKIAPARSATPTPAQDAAANAMPSELVHEPATHGEPAGTVQPTLAATPATSASSPSVGQGPDNITVYMSADAWVAIRDHTGHRLAYETMPAGTNRSFYGQAPFAVVLGNSPATRLELNGQPFEQPKPRAGTVARFKVGQSSDEGASTGTIKGAR
jgi:cytoskeleton protein RodZ